MIIIKRPTMLNLDYYVENLFYKHSRNFSKRYNLTIDLGLFWFPVLQDQQRDFFHFKKEMIEMILRREMVNTK